MNLLCPTAKPTSLRKLSSLISQAGKAPTLQVHQAVNSANLCIFWNFWKCLVSNWAYSYITVASPNWLPGVGNECMEPIQSCLTYCKWGSVMFAPVCLPINQYAYSIGRACDQPSADRCYCSVSTLTISLTRWKLGASHRDCFPYGPSPTSSEHEELV